LNNREKGKYSMYVLMSSKGTPVFYRAILDVDYLCNKIVSKQEFLKIIRLIEILSPLKSF
jgi:hypothetical protein